MIRYSIIVLAIIGTAATAIAAITPNHDTLETPSSQRHGNREKSGFSAGRPHLRRGLRTRGLLGGSRRLNQSPGRPPSPANPCRPDFGPRIFRGPFRSDCPCPAAAKPAEKIISEFWRGVMFGTSFVSRPGLVSIHRQPEHRRTSGGETNMIRYSIFVLAIVGTAATAIARHHPGPHRPLTTAQGRNVTVMREETAGRPPGLTNLPGGPHPLQTPSRPAPGSSPDPKINAR